MQVNTVASNITRIFDIGMNTNPMCLFIVALVQIYEQVMAHSIKQEVKNLHVLMEIINGIAISTNKSSC